MTRRCVRLMPCRTRSPHLTGTGSTGVAASPNPSVTFTSPPISQILNVSSPTYPDSHPLHDVFSRTSDDLPIKTHCGPTTESPNPLSAIGQPVPIITSDSAPQRRRDATSHCSVSPRDLFLLPFNLPALMMGQHRNFDNVGPIHEITQSARNQCAYHVLSGRLREPPPAEIIEHMSTSPRVLVRPHLNMLFLR
jgi:hypothetical protein